MNPKEMFHFPPLYLQIKTTFPVPGKQRVNSHKTRPKLPRSSLEARVSRIPEPPAIICRLTTFSRNSPRAVTGSGDLPAATKRRFHV